MASRPQFDQGTGSTKPARFLLRDSTRADHDRVDAAFSRFALDTVEGYADFLCAQYLAHREVESWLALSHLPAEFRLADRTPLIAADLADLGRPLPAQGLPSPMPSSAGFAVCAGVLYCVAGSSFGAQVLIQRLPHDAPARFLAQPLPAGYWQRLVVSLETIARQGALPATLAAARRTFALFATSAERVVRKGASA